MIGRKNALKIVAIATVFTVILTACALTGSNSADGTRYVLMDEGDGDTYWSTTTTSNIFDSFKNAASEMGVDLDFSGDTFTVDGVSDVTVGSQTVSWRIYEWDGSDWSDITSDVDSSTTSSSSIALGLYPEGTIPTETPVFKESWTSVRGNSTMDKVMTGDLESEDDFTIVKAYSRGNADYITGTILLAHGNAYPFFNGGYMNTQNTPALYCVDASTGETKWTVEVPAGVGYETQTGCIVGDYYYLPISYGYIYKIPLDGPGDITYSVAISSRLMIDSAKQPAVTSVMYKGPGDSGFIAAEIEYMDTNVFNIPVTIGSTYSIIISDGSRTYNGSMVVSEAGALGVKITGDSDADTKIIGDFSTRVTYNYSEVDKVYFSKKKVSDLEGRNIYSTGAASLTPYGGAIFFGTSAGNTYAVDLDLNILWKTDTRSQNYFDSVMIKDDRAFVGTYSGTLYALDVTDGSIKASVAAGAFPSVVYGDGGRVCTPVMVDDILFFSTSDGLGMNSTQGGIAAYRFKNDSFTQMFSETEYGQGSTYTTAVITDSFRGVYFSTDEGLYSLSTDMKFTLITDQMIGIRASPTLVNNQYLFMADYAYEKNGVGGKIHILDLEGNILAEFQRPSEVDQWTMSPVIVIDDHIYGGTDNGFYIFAGKMLNNNDEPEVGGGINPLWIAIGVIVVLMIIFLIICYFMGKKKNMSLGNYLSSLVTNKSGFHNDSMSKTKANKRRLAIVLIVGSLTAVIIFICCLAYGPSMSLTPWEAISNMFSAIGKGGEGLTLSELVVYESRLPRAIAAVAVGIGLAVAGCIYQAVIRNPMVDPYIMGVSSGAGTFAVAAIASGFTFFGLLENSNYMVPVLAILGGLIAFGLTMLLASKAGNTATSYVLAGVVIGLAFSSIQTVILTTSDSEKLHSAISWLYGSFTSVDWGTVWLIFFPALFLSLAFFFWAKELNLVLLGDENAQQMGLNVKKFDALMLILASVLTSVCVAFVGIIGFVGLVVPHICRMILGGDHRLVLPASVVLGAALMLLADLLARMIMIPLELPVGAITTVIGVPVFAYLLVKKGRIYNG